jgi:hypothetical protein
MHAACMHKDSIQFISHLKSVTLLLRDVQRLSSCMQVSKTFLIFASLISCPIFKLLNVKSYDSVGGLGTLMFKGHIYLWFWGELGPGGYPFKVKIL